MAGSVLANRNFNPFMLFLIENDELLSSISAKC